MSTSKGQCCDDCITTRAYTSNGKNIWNRNFGTDTIDLFTSGNDIFLIGNNELSFQYLDEIKITNPSGQKENYLIPFTAFLNNHSNFGNYDDKGKFIHRDELEEFTSSKDLFYIRSYEFNQLSGDYQTSNSNIISNLYSYPFEQYDNSDNTKTARIFAANSGIYIVKPNHVFNYQINSSSNNYDLKSIGFIGANYDIPSYQSGLIYLGGEKYCHGVIELLERFQFISGSPSLSSRERINIIFNYEPNYSGILNGTGIIGTLNFNYYDKNRSNQLNFLFKKDKAYVSLLGTGCSYSLAEISDINKIYRSTGLLIDEQSYDNNNNPIHPSWSIYNSNWINQHHYSGQYNGVTLCKGSGDLKHAWDILDYNIDLSVGKIKIGLEKIIDETLDSGCNFFRYDSSLFTGIEYPVTGDGIINGYFSYYDITGLRSTINSFSITNINNTSDIYINQFNRIIDKNPEISFISYDIYSGLVLRNSNIVGNWNLSDFDIDYRQKSNDAVLMKLNTDLRVNDNSVDYKLLDGTGNKYTTDIFPFFNYIGSGEISDINIIIDYNIAPFSTGCAGVAYGFVVTETPTVSPQYTCSLSALNFPLEYMYSKHSRNIVSNAKYYMFNFLVDSGIYQKTHSEIGSFGSYLDYYIPTVFNGFNDLLSPNPLCFESLPYDESGIGLYVGVRYPPQFIVNHQSLSYISLIPTGTITFKQPFGHHCCFNFNYIINQPVLNISRWLYKYYPIVIPPGNTVNHFIPTSICMPGTASNYYAHNNRYPTMRSGLLPMLNINGNLYGINAPGDCGIGFDCDFTEADLSISGFYTIPSLGKNYIGLAGGSQIYSHSAHGSDNCLIKFPTCFNVDSGCRLSFFNENTFFTIGFGGWPCSGYYSPIPLLHRVVGRDFVFSGEIFNHQPLFNFWTYPCSFGLSGNNYYSGVKGYLYVETMNDWDNIVPDVDYQFIASGQNYSKLYNNNNHFVFTNNTANILPDIINNKDYRF